MRKHPWLTGAFLALAWFVLCLTPNADAQIVSTANIVANTINTPVTLPNQPLPSVGAAAMMTVVASAGTMSCGTYPIVQLVDTRNSVPLDLADITTSNGTTWTAVPNFTQILAGDSIAAQLTRAGVGCTNELPLAVTLTYSLAAGICYANPSACVTLDGQLAGPNGLNAQDFSLTFTPSQLTVLAGQLPGSGSGGGGGGGGGTGTVTSITAVFPSVVTPSPITNTGVISLQNEADVNITSAHGTGTGICAWSGGDSTQNDYIIGDGTGGCTDSGVQLNNYPIGGIVGGVFGTGSGASGTATQLGIFNECTNFTCNSQGPMPFSAFLNNLWVYTTGSSPSSPTYLGFSNGEGEASVDYAETVRTVIPSNATAGAYGQTPNSPPFKVLQGQNASMEFHTYASTQTSATVAGWSAEVVGSTSQPLVSMPGLLGGPATSYQSPGSATPDGCCSTEATVAVAFPYSGTLKNFCSVISGSTGGSAGTDTGTVRVNGASTALTVSFPYGIDGVFTPCDTTDTVSVSAGNWFTFQHVATTFSYTSLGDTVELVPSGSATGMIVFGVTLVAKDPPTTPYTIYLPAFGGGELYYSSGGSPPTTEANVRTPMPRAVVAKNLYCTYTVARPATATLIRNGSATPLTVTIPDSAGEVFCNGSSGPYCVSDLTDTVSFAPGDTFDLQLSQASGSGLVAGACSMEVD